MNLRPSGYEPSGRIGSGIAPPGTLKHGGGMSAQTRTDTPPSASPEEERNPPNYPLKSSRASHSLKGVRNCPWGPGVLALGGREKPATAYREFRRFFTCARRRAELVDQRFHDLRHTFAFWWVLRGGDVYVLQHILGHSSTQMVQRYAHLTSDAQHKAMSDLFPHSFDVLEGKIPHSSD